MSNSLYGQIPEFYGDGDDWNVYYERLEQFFTVNDIPQDKRSAFLISVIGSYTYKTLRDLCHPTLPKDKSFEELCELLHRQFSPQVSIFRERAKFYNAKQESFENISTWYAKVKKLSVDCKFGSNLAMVLLDKFITGLRSGSILDRLCEENETITLQQALDIAINKESALAVELPPPINERCFECCVPPPQEDEEVLQIPEDIPSRPPSSVASDSGFKELQISRCPPMRESIFQRQHELEAPALGGVVNDAPILCRRKSKALLGKPIGSPMSEMPSRPPIPDMGFGVAPPMAMAMASAPMPSLDAVPMLCAKPIMRKTMMGPPKDVEDNVKIEPLINDDITVEKKKKNRRGCRGGRKNKKRTESE